MSAILNAIALFVVLWLLKSLVQFVRRMRILLKVPRSPRTKFFFGNVLDLLSVPRTKLSLAFLKITRPMAKNPVFCVWIFHMPRIIIARAKSAEEVLSSNALLQKAGFYELLHPWLGLGLLTSTGDQWRAHRKLLTPSFHFRILDNFLPIFNEQSAILVSKLKERAGKRRFNIYPYITLCVLDIICETAMGTKINAQRGSNSEYVNAITTVSEILLTRNLKVWLLNPWIFALSRYGRLQKKCLRILHQFTIDVINERRREYEAGVRPQTQGLNGELVFGQKRRLAFLDTLLEASDNFKRLSIREIQQEVDTFMFEGHDTTAVAIGWALQHLGWLPSVQDKVHEELDQVFGDSDRDVTLEDLANLKYLGATIKESLRVTPSVPIYGRRITKDTEICGVTIPADTDILINPSMIAIDEEIYKHPFKFDPDRFLSEEWLHHHPYSYVPFSAGPRNCIGQKFALMEEKVVLATILRKFRVLSHVSVDLTGPVPDVVLRPLNGFQLELIERTCKK